MRQVDTGTWSLGLAARLPTDVTVGPDGRLFVATTDGIYTLGPSTGSPGSGT